MAAPLRAIGGAVQAVVDAIAALVEPVLGAVTAPIEPLLDAIAAAVGHVCGGLRRRAPWCTRATPN